MTEDRRVGWHHRLDGHELEWTGKSCSPWGRKKSDTTDGTELNWGYCTGGSRTGVGVLRIYLEGKINLGGWRKLSEQEDVVQPFG